MITKCYLNRRQTLTNADKKTALGGPIDTLPFGHIRKVQTPAVKTLPETQTCRKPRRVLPQGTLHGTKSNDNQSKYPGPEDQVFKITVNNQLG
jgi:hypothetical protein